MDNKIIEFTEKLNRADKIAILMHNNPDGDALGSASALYEILCDNFDKKADILYPGVIPDFLKSVQNYDKALSIRNHKPSVPYDLIISVDTAVALLHRDEGMKIFSEAKDTVKIDHHQDSEDFANLNIHQFLPSAAEVIYNMAKAAGWKININAANSIYTAIYTDTGNFKYIDKPDTFEIVTSLVKLGVSPRDIAENLSLTKKDSTLINAQAVSSAQFFFQDKLALSIINKEQRKLMDGKGSEAMRMLSGIDTVEYVALIKEGKDDEIFVSFRSKLKPVIQFANELGGGGHTFAAAAKIIGTISSAKEEILLVFEKLLGEKR